MDNVLLLCRKKFVQRSLGRRQFRFTCSSNNLVCPETLYLANLWKERSESVKRSITRHLCGDSNPRTNVSQTTRDSQRWQMQSDIGLSREDKDIDWHVRVTGKVASLIHSTIPSSPEAFPPASLYFTWTLLTEGFECFIFFRVISLSRSDGNCTLVRFVSMESVLNIRVSFLWKKTIDFEIHLDKT